MKLQWQTTQPPEPHKNIFIHLLDANGNSLGQLDGPPYDGLYPLPDWLPGQFISDTRSLGSQLDDINQLKAIAIGIYDTVSGERLPALDATGQPLPNNAFILDVTP